MSDNVHRIADGTMAPVMASNYDANVDYVINEYMERLGTRLNILETELKYAWRALDLLSQEYIKMWERLEKLEGLLYEQQSVISQLLDFYTSGGAGCRADLGAGAAAVLDSRLGELEVIREILGNGTVEDGLEEGLDVSRVQSTTIQELELDEMHVPDEAFYRSLNQAYREDLVGCDLPQTSQLGMIWEEREEQDESNDKKELTLDESEEVFSALDYKDYRGNSPCISEQDIAQLSRIDTIDHVAIEKLNELDRLSSKLQQDSDNIKQLQRKLLESPITIADGESKTEETSSKSLDLRHMYNEPEWSFSSGSRDQDDLILLAKSELPNSIPYSTRPSSRLSVTDSVVGNDSEVAEALAGGIRTPTSPRRRSEAATCSAPFTTVTGRLAYSAAVQHVDAAAANSKNPFYCGNLIAASYEALPCSTPNIFSVKSERAASPSLSVSSMRTRQDGYVNTTNEEHEVQTKGASPSPPPPAPLDVCDSVFLMPNATPATHAGPSPVFLGTDSVPTSSISLEQRRSPKSSPKRNKANIVAAKSDSGLSSMSGWSSLEKSPGSPKNLPPKIAALNYYTNRPASPVPDNRPYMESNTDSVITSHSNILPGGHHLSAFTTVKSPCSLETPEGYGTFVPAPAPASDINVSPRRKKHTTKANTMGEFMYRNDQPAIYSVAGSNRETYTSVYTSNSADYINQTINYPDLIEPYENNEFHNTQRHFTYNSLTTSQGQTESPNRRKSLTRMYSTSNGHDLANHEGYKTAMYRTMFPSGNITDALSYYPTSSRYENVQMPPGDYNEPSAWLNCPPDSHYQDSASPSSSMRSTETSEYNQSPYLDQRRQQRQPQPIYENQAQIDQHNRQWSQRQEIPYLELDLRNRNVPEYIVQQQQHGDNKYFDASNVIITQSGYLTINSETVDSSRDERPKKSKRSNTLKLAMNSVSQWLPDLHLTKRHRSYSLPSGVRREDLMERAKSNHVKSNVAPRKKKKNAIVSTVSGILQKAKRKTHYQHQAQSLSDPEQSENEWVIQRASSVISEDDRSEDSYSLFDNPPDTDLFAKVSKPKLRKNSQQDVVQKNEEEPQPTFEQIKKSPQPSDISPRVDEESETIAAEEEISGKSTGSGSSSIFPTIGDTKRSSASSEKSDETVVTDSKMVVVVGGASMEFAVSRALGKYRQQKQTPSFSDDQLSEHGVVIEEILDEEPTFEEPKSEKLVEQISTESQCSDSSKAISNGEFNNLEGSPSATSLRIQVNKYLPRHQQSLEIPGHKLEDDDSRSTHSWRSTSRVSSRRQSTEDSIDSEDEWYCYELKKLEEMERQSVLEAEMGETLREEPELEEMFEPYEEVKEKMSFVLRELRMKAKVLDGVLDEKDNNLHVIQSAKHRENHRQEVALEEAHMLFNKIREFKEEESREPTPEPKEEEHSSGETSGPDSPQASAAEDEDEEEATTQGFARCHVPVKEKPVEQAPVEPEEPKHNTSEASAVPKIQIDADTSKPELAKEAAGPMGSKWKLLKALKERKAEEKSNQVKVTEATSEKDKVSMLGMMQKFYEIHVKT